MARVVTTVRLPEGVHEAAVAAATADGRSLNNWLERVLQAHLTEAGLLEVEPIAQQAS